MRKFCKRLFKKEIDELISKYQAAIDDVECERKQYEKQRELLRRIFRLHPDAYVIGVENNKRGDELIIVFSNETLLLFGNRYRGMTGNPRLLFTVRKDPEKGTFIKIEDVITEDDDVGNGTILMYGLFKYARETDTQWIEGWLSPVDDDHADRRDYYYRKFGFEITGDRIRIEREQILEYLKKKEIRKV